MSTVSDYFGSMVFDDKVMRSMLSADIYRSLRKTINQGNPLNPDVANAVAQAMKNWAVSKGATHYTHWFQPLNGVMEMIKKVAERHDFVALLHEKPFEGVNGSGKHNNWSLATDKGANLMSPGDTPQDNLLPAMDRLRHDSDSAEAVTSKNYWPLPNYGLLLFGEK